MVLTKKLGVGIITTALKGDVAAPAHVRAAVESMSALNRVAAQVIRQAGIHACTDVTGFGLLGHSYEMAEKSSATHSQPVRIRYRVSQLPFHDGALGYADDWLFPAGACTNETFYRPHVQFHDIDEAIEMLLFTPETSGGLLIAVPAAQLDDLLGRFAAVGQDAWVIGEVIEGEPGVDVVG